MLTCHERLQPFGLLVWAATGKDPGLWPHLILNMASRTARYSAAEYSDLEFDGPTPTPMELGVIWRSALAEAADILEILPPRMIGHAVMSPDGALFRGTLDELRDADAAGLLRYHPPAVGGACPVIVG